MRLFSNSISFLSQNDLWGLTKRQLPFFQFKMPFNFFDFCWLYASVCGGKVFRKWIWCCGHAYVKTSVEKTPAFFKTWVDSKGSFVRKYFWPCQNKFRNCFKSNLLECEKNNKVLPFRPFSWPQLSRLNHSDFGCPVEDGHFCGLLNRCLVQDGPTFAQILKDRKSDHKRFICFMFCRLNTSSLFQSKLLTREIKTTSYKRIKNS